MTRLSTALAAVLALSAAGCGGRAIRARAPASADDAEGTRSGSLDPLGDWESVLANGSPADMFRYLANDDFDAAQDKVRSLRPSQHDGLTDYVLSSCGRKTATWKFVVSPDLPENERRFAAWYLKTQTSYKPK